MTVILKTKDRLVKMYWISLQANSIVGWFTGTWLHTMLGLPDNIHFDSHFTFPKDGNYHFSYKSINDLSEEFVSVYWDKAKVKTITNGERSIFEKEREEFEESNPILSTLVPVYKPEPLDKIAFFQFPSVCFNVYDGTFKSRNSDNVIKVEEINTHDLVVDVCELNNVNLAIYAAIVSDKNKFLFNDTIHRSFMDIEMANGRTLELGCNIFAI
jgi:hypothetical protein